MTAPLDEEPSLRSMQLMTIETNDSSDDDDYEDNDVGTPDYINDFQYQTEQYEQEEPIFSAISTTDTRSHTETSALRVVIIPGLHSTSHILFRCQPTLNNYSLCQNLLMNAISQPDSWAQQLHFSDHSYHWYHNDVLQLNANGFPIRLFHIPLPVNQTDLTADTLLHLCDNICTMLTISARNQETITYDEQNLFWLQGNVVWADVIGTNKALSIIRSLRCSSGHGFYERNEYLLLPFFHSHNGQLSPTKRDQPQSPSEH